MSEISEHDLPIDCSAENLRQWHRDRMFTDKGKALIDASRTQSESTRTPIESSRDEVEEAKAKVLEIMEMWFNSTNDERQAAAEEIMALVAHIRTQERERDTELLDWLQERTVDTIYLDDGQIIDVRGNSVRDAIAAAIREG